MLLFLVRSNKGKKVPKRTPTHFLMPWVLFSSKLQNGTELHYSQIRKGNQIRHASKASYCCKKTTQIVLLRNRECIFFFKKQTLWRWCFLNHIPNHRIQCKHKSWELYSSLKTLGTPWHHRWKLRWQPFQKLQLLSQATANIVSDIPK